MTPERINAVIAEWMGWKRIDSERFNDWVHPNAPGWHSRTPNYYGDLNATREPVGKVVTDERFCWDYMNHLRTILKINEDEYLGSIQQSMILTATAAQRCEALLRTIGRWEGE